MCTVQNNQLYIIVIVWFDFILEIPKINLFNIKTLLVFTQIRNYEQNSSIACHWAMGLFKMLDLFWRSYSEYDNELFFSQYGTQLFKWNERNKKQLLRLSCTYVVSKSHLLSPSIMDTHVQMHTYIYIQTQFYPLVRRTWCKRKNYKTLVTNWE